MSRPRIHIPRFVGGVAATPIVAETELWRDEVIANGGAVSDDRLIIVNRFIRKEIQMGLWNLTDDYLAFWAEDEPQALTSLKQLRLATVTAAPVFTADRDYTFDGATNFVDTGYIPNTHNVALSATSMRLATYERAALALNNTRSAGVSSGIADDANLFLDPRRTTGSMTGAASCAAFNVASPITADGLGLSSVNRSGTTFSFRRRGVLVNTAVPTAINSTLPTFSIYVGGTNASGSLVSPGARQIGFFVVGGGLTLAQELSQYNNIQEWANAVGAGV